MARKCGISPSTLSTFIKSGAKIEKNNDSYAVGSQWKRILLADCDQADQAVYERLVESGRKKITINGSMMAKEPIFALSFGFMDFKGALDNNWRKGRST
jgi:hypothetical protein